jgi:hypothetical protein
VKVPGEDGTGYRGLEEGADWQPEAWAVPAEPRHLAPEDRGCMCEY